MEENRDLFDSNIDNDTAQEMYSAAKWARSFAIVIFIICGLAVLLLFAMGNMINELIAEGVIPGTVGSEASSIMLIAIAVGVAFVVITMFFLFRGANSVRTALKQKDQALFNRGLSDLKVYFTIFGVVCILSLLSNLIKLV